MPATATVRKLYRVLLATPGSRNAMLVLGDALEEAGSPALAEAYRWAAWRNKWPHRLEGRGPRGLYVRQDIGKQQSWRVYDWTRWVPRKKQLDVDRRWTERSMLDKRLIAAIIRDRRRRYGGVNRAFLILACAFQGREVGGATT